MPAFRQINRSPGSVCMIRSGTIRESAHVIKRASGLCAPAERFKELFSLRKDIPFETDIRHKILHVYSSWERKPLTWLLQWLLRAGRPE